MRRLAAFAALAVLVAGCSDSVPGNRKLTTPTPDTVIGKLPTTTTTPLPPGNAAAGKPLFISSGCGACHVFTPAGSAAVGKVGPDLDHLAEYATQANQGTLEQFTATSITNPAAYVAPGYPAGVMPSTYSTSLKPQQIADLVAFLTKAS